MAVTSNDGDEFGDFGVKPTNLDEKETKASKARGFQKFPMAVHKQNGLTKEVADEAGLEDALSKGWFEDIRHVPADEGAAEPTKVSEMTVEQAVAFVAQASVTELVVIEADEASHGNRAPVLTAIEAAKDNVKPAKGGKPAKAKGGK